MTDRMTRRQRPVLWTLRALTFAGCLFCAISLSSVSMGQAPPANDVFADALAITGPAATLSSANAGTTKETGEPAHAGNAGGKSLWWSWTAPAEGTVTLDTVGSSFDTLLAVYAGDTVSNLVSVAASDDIGLPDVASRLSFSATLGTVYRVCVDGYGGDEGRVVLNLWLGSLPPQM